MLDNSCIDIDRAASMPLSAASIYKNRIRMLYKYKNQFLFFKKILPAGFFFVTAFWTGLYGSVQSQSNLRLKEFYGNERDNGQNFLHKTVLMPCKHDVIEKFTVRYLNEDGLKYLESIMQRSVTYRSFIKEELRKENLPQELLFLPVIESGFYSKAVSKAGAAGIWQFMRNSIGGYNININEWLDERYDPWKASTAAVKKLKWNYQYYGDWYLALAAYNCGIGALNKVIKKAGKADYWYLRDKGFLNKETAAYVPKFIAVSEILMQSDKYGIDWGEELCQEMTATVETKRSVDVVLLAEMLESDPKLFLNLNPSLKFNITPPNIKYNLRVPAEYKEAVETLIAEEKLLLKYYNYKIKSGDTLSGLSKDYGVSIAAILNYNPKLNKSSLQIGHTIMIPALKDVDINRKKQKADDQAFNGIYTIKKGDSLWSIALQYNIPVELLAEKNNLALNSILSLGRTLKVPIL